MTSVLHICVLHNGKRRVICKSQEWQKTYKEYLCRNVCFSFERSLNFPTAKKQQFFEIRVSLASLSNFALCKFARTSKLKQVVINLLDLHQRKMSWCLSAPYMLTKPSTLHTLLPKNLLTRSLLGKVKAASAGSEEPTLQKELHCIVSSYFVSIEVQSQDILGSCPCLQHFMSLAPVRQSPADISQQGTVKLLSCDFC